MGEWLLAIQTIKVDQVESGFKLEETNIRSISDFN